MLSLPAVCIMPLNNNQPQHRVTTCISDGDHQRLSSPPGGEKQTSSVRFTLGGVELPQVDITLPPPHQLPPGHVRSHNHREQVIEKQWHQQQQLQHHVLTEDAMPSNHHQHQRQNTAVVTRSISNSTDVSQQSVDIDVPPDDVYCDGDDEDVTLHLHHSAHDEHDHDDVNHYGMFDDTYSKRQCAYIADRIASCLTRGAAAAASSATLVLPVGLTLRAAQDVMRLAESEPCGVRGCHLLVMFESVCVGSIRLGAAAAVPPTFQLVLTLHRDESKLHWWHLVTTLPFPHCLAAAAQGSHVILSAGFTMVKNRLYRT